MEMCSLILRPFRIFQRFMGSPGYEVRLTTKVLSTYVFIVVHISQAPYVAANYMHATTLG